MKKYIVSIAILLALLTSATAVAAVTWKETGAGPQFRIDPRTHATQVGFYLVLKYNPIPSCLALDINWEVYHGAKQLAHDHQPADKQCGHFQSVSMLSPFITPVPGESYRATITITDTINHLTYTRTITYTTPLSFPTGIGVNVKTPNGETHTIDWTGVTDKEVTQLAGYYATYTADYVQTASAVPLTAFTQKYAATSDAYPVWVWVFATIGPQIKEQGPHFFLHATYNRILFLYRVPALEDMASVLTQLAVFNDKFPGRVLVRTAPPASTAPQYVFIGDGAWKMLASAAQEAKKRTPKK